MGRISSIDEEKLFAVVGRLLALQGSITLQDVVAETGVSIGSLYHRYGSREGLLAQTWLDAVRTFQARFMEEINGEDQKAGERAALVTSRFCREEPERAAVLACCRKSEFISESTPQSLKKEIAHINDDALAALESYARRMGLSLEVVQLGIMAFPLGAVRMYLPDKKIPKSVDDHILKAFRAVTGLGDTQE